MVATLSWDSSIGWASSCWDPDCSGRARDEVGTDRWGILGAGTGVTLGAFEDDAEAERPRRAPLSAGLVGLAPAEPRECQLAGDGSPMKTLTGIYYPRVRT